MSYLKYGKVEAVDFNTLVGATNGSTPLTLNYIWGTGNGDTGYGQPAVARVAQNASVTAQDWQHLIAASITMGTHQGTVMSEMTAPNPDDTILYIKAASDNLTNLYKGRHSAIQQGSSYQKKVSQLGTWYDSVSFTHTATFETPDSARFFFNSGGQLKLNFAHPAGDRVNALFNQMCIDCGAVVFSAMADTTVPSEATINGLKYEGVTKVGGTGLPNVRKAGTGYFGLTTNDQVIFSQAVIGTPAKYYTYTGSNITVTARTNGPQGGNGDNGTVITFTTTWDQTPNGVPVTGSSNSYTTLIVQPPATLAATDTLPAFKNTWGTVILDGSVSGT